MCKVKYRPNITRNEVVTTVCSEPKININTRNTTAKINKKLMKACTFVSPILLTSVKTFATEISNNASPMTGKSIWEVGADLYKKSCMATYWIILIHGVYQLAVAFKDGDGREKIGRIVFNHFIMAGAIPVMKIGVNWITDYFAPMGEAMPTWFQTGIVKGASKWLR